MAEDYDVLSELGHVQARRLGEHWAQLGLHLDTVYAGPRRRQRHTAEIVGEALSDAGLPWPEVRVLDELDEYHAEPMLKRFVPELAAEHAHVRELMEAFAQAGDRREHAKRFERLFQAVMRLWAQGAFGAPDVESWAAFRERAERALATVTGDARSGRRVAAFSSGGAIGTAVGAILGTSPETMLELGWTLNNCGVAEVLFSAERRSLSRYNDIGHLRDPDLWSYR